jgi:Carboxypeptidase regulatory-like domain
MHRRRLLSATGLLFGIFLMAGGTVITVPFAAAQNAAATQRIVQGKVVDSNEAPAEGAIVYLRNDKTQEVRTYISTQGGAYRFGQLSSNADYSLWAEYQNKKSKNRTISSFDEKRVFNFTLKLDINK